VLPLLTSYMGLIDVGLVYQTFNTRNLRTVALVTFTNKTIEHFRAITLVVNWHGGSWLPQPYLTLVRPPVMPFCGIIFSSQSLCTFSREFREVLIQGQIMVMIRSDD